MFHEPDAVGAEVKGVAGLMHVSRQDGEENRLPVTCSDLHGHFGFCRQVDVVAIHFQQPLHLNAFEKARRCAVIEDRRRFLGLIVQIDLHGMPLAGADARAIGAELEALFGVGGDDVVEVSTAQGMPGFGAARKQIFDTRPACGVESDMGGFRLMPQDQTEKFAGTGGLGGVHLKLKLIAVR